MKSHPTLSKAEPKGALCPKERSLMATFVVLVLEVKKDETYQVLIGAWVS